MQKISPFLWFNDQAEQVVNFYVSLFKDARITSIARYQEDSPGPVGSVMTMGFSLFGQEFVALNGGPVYQFNPAISFVVHCQDQVEVDHYWDALSNGGQTMQCGWLTDRFGVTWQIVPDALFRLLGDPDPGRAYRANQAMLKMIKLDIAALERAADGN